jgi:hypothetical protein
MGSSRKKTGRDRIPHLAVQVGHLLIRMTAIARKSCHRECEPRIPESADTLSLSLSELSSVATRHTSLHPLAAAAVMRRAGDSCSFSIDRSCAAADRRKHTELQEVMGWELQPTLAAAVDPDLYIHVRLLPTGHDAACVSSSSSCVRPYYIGATTTNGRTSVAWRGVVVPIAELRSSTGATHPSPRGPALLIPRSCP